MPRDVVFPIATTTVATTTVATTAVATTTVATTTITTAALAAAALAAAALAAATLAARSKPGRRLLEWMQRAAGRVHERLLRPWRRVLPPGLGELADCLRQRLPWLRQHSLLHRGGLRPTTAAAGGLLPTTAAARPTTAARRLLV